MLNKVVLMGRLTADPELKQTANGIPVLSFSIAVDRSFAARGTERQTDFINIVAMETDRRVYQPLFYERADDCFGRIDPNAQL